MMRKARHVIELWQSLGLGRVPSRDRFRIYNFPMLEPHLFAATVAKRLEDFRIDIAGHAVEKSYGAQLTGKSFGELDLGPARDSIVEEYAVCASKRTAIASSHRMHMSDDSTVELQRVLLPFTSPLSGDIAQVIGWFHISPLPKRGVKGAVTRWVTQERSLVAADTAI
jgi:hypothetical protein